MASAAVVERIHALAGADPDRRHRLARLSRVSLSSDWSLLTAHALVDGRSMSMQSVHCLYLHLTDRLVSRIVDGRFDRVVFLDKSARPVCWLTLACWEQLAVAFDPGSVVRSRWDRPAVTFLNIDREQWRDVLDPQQVGDFDARRLPPAALAGLRRSMLRSAADQRLSAADLANAATWFDGQRVLVVDEVSVSGDTANMAVDMLRTAFPLAEFETAHWMRPRLVTGRDGNRRNNLLPVWYREETAAGRGVGDRDPEASLRSVHWRVRAGAWFLSRPHPPTVRDVEGRLLRAELYRLAAGLLAGHQVLVPDLDREDAEARCQWFNGVDLRQLLEWRVSSGVILDI